MPKKSTGKSSRARVSRPSRPAARPAAVLPIGNAPLAPPPVAPSVGSTMEPMTARPSRAPSRAYRAPRGGGLIPITDYSYVMHDLRRIAMLAAAAFVVLGALTFVVH